MRTIKAGHAASALILLAASAVAWNATPATADVQAATTQYSVLAADGASRAAVEAAIRAAGGVVGTVNTAVGLYQVTAPADGFVMAVASSSAVLGAAHARPIGSVPTKRPEVETPTASGTTVASAAATSAADPLDGQLWGQQMIRADRAHTVTLGSRAVRVGVLDTGIDASSPDLAPNFSAPLSRNFVTDLPDIDGPCEAANCVDPVGVDDNGHGTHVAGIIGAAKNGIGITGVAPNVTLVEVRGGQDSGYFFLDPVVNALTYGANIGLDVINMSFYVDPWLYNCTSNPADSPQAQIEQRTIIASMNRALDYAYDRGVTLVAALGNNHEDLGHPRTDVSSPDYGGAPYGRVIDNSSCLNLPAEGDHVIGVSSVGPSARKADYSNYGIEQISVAAPGGWFRDGVGTPTYRSNGNEILSTYPLHVLQQEGSVDAAGNLTPAGTALGVAKSCPAQGPCGYYQYLQGTSMASPQVAGVAALIVGRFGKKDASGVTLAPAKTESMLLRSAHEHACPEPRLFSYADVGRSAEFDATCEGTTNFNGFYGYGIVDAYAAVTIPPAWSELP